MHGVAARCLTRASPIPSAIAHEGLFRAFMPPNPVRNFYVTVGAQYIWLDFFETRVDTLQALLV